MATRHNPDVESEIENCQKWVRKALALQEQQAAEIVRLTSELAQWKAVGESNETAYREVSNLLSEMTRERDALAKRWEALRDWMAALTVPDYYVALWMRGYVTLQTTTLAKMSELEAQR